MCGKADVYTKCPSYHAQSLKKMETDVDEANGMSLAAA